MAYPTIPTIPPIGGEPFATLQNAAIIDGNGTALSVVGMSTVALTIKTTGYSGTITFEVTENGTDYIAVLGTQVGTTTVATNTGALTTDTSTTSWQVEVSGMQAFIAVLSSTSAGSVTITAHASTAPTAAVPISSTVGTVTQSTASSLKSLVTTNADAAIAAGTAPSKAIVTGGVYNSTPPTLTTGQTVAQQFDASGNTLVKQVTPYPYGAIPETNSSGNVAAATATATLAAASGKTTYITGFEVTGAGATGALVVNVTVVGVITGTMTYTYAAVAGAAVINTPLIVQFPYPIPASATNTTIVVSCPTLGTGNLNNTVVAHGFQL